MVVWEIWAKKTNNHSQIMAVVLIKSDSAGFFVQIFHKTMERFFSIQWVMQINLITHDIQRFI